MTNEPGLYDLLEGLDLIEGYELVLNEEEIQLARQIAIVRLEMVEKYGVEEADRLIDEVFNRICEEPYCVDDEDQWLMQ